MTQKQLNESAESTLERLFSIMREYDVVELMKMLTSPFSSWPAYRVGLIDGNGKILRLPKTQKEKVYLQPLVILLLDMKKNLLPVFKNTNYASYIQALNRVELRNKKVMESTNTSDMAPLVDPMNKTKSFKVAPHIYRRLKSKIDDGQNVDINSFPLKIQENLKKTKPDIIYILDEQKNILKITGDKIIW